MRKIAWGLTAVLCMATGLAAQEKRETDPDKARVTVDLQNTTFGDVLDFVNQATGIPVEFDAEAKQQLNRNEAVSIKVQDIQLTGFFQLLLHPRGFSVKAVDKKKIVVSVRKD